MGYEVGEVVSMDIQSGNTVSAPFNCLSIEVIIQLIE